MTSVALSRPSTPREALAAALVSTSGCSTEVAERGALDLLDALGDLGWHCAPDVTLPESAPAGDPRTAPAAIGDLSDRAWSVWYVLCLRGPCTDEEAVERYDLVRAETVLPAQSPQSVRSRRAELVRAGHVIATGERRRTRNGGTAQVWRATGEAGVRAA